MHRYQRCCRTVIAAMTILLGSGASTVVAQNETPTDDCGRIFEPYSWDLGTGVGDACEKAMDDQHYCLLRTTTTAPGTKEKPPAVTVRGIWAAMTVGYGVFTVDTHGNTPGFAVEAYDYDTGLKARDIAYEAYQANPIFKDKIWKADVEDVAYGIGITADAIKEWFSDEESIVFNSSCYGNAYAGDWGARVVLDYDEGVGCGAAIEDAEHFWERLDGKHGDDKRTAKEAKPDRMTLTGEGNTVLSPIVVDFGPRDYADGGVEFDTKMDTTIPANSVVYAVGAIPPAR